MRRGEVHVHDASGAKWEERSAEREPMGQVVELSLGA
jgi:hypothetical protein